MREDERIKNEKEKRVWQMMAGEKKTLKQLNWLNWLNCCCV